VHRTQIVDKKSSRIAPKLEPQRLPTPTRTVWVKKNPPWGSWHFLFFSQTVKNFSSIFYTPIIRSYLC